MSEILIGKSIVAVIAALLAVAGNVPYVRDILRGSVTPHAYTWFVWSLVSGITLAGQLIKGAGVGALPTAVSELFTILIFLLSLRYGFNGATKTDSIFLILALLALVPWAITRDPTLSVVIAVSIDLIAFVPTFRKAWEQPTTEGAMLYGMNVLRHALALFSLQAYNIATTLHSVAMIIVNVSMTVLLIARRRDMHARHADVGER